jgi:hypothetical protein
MSAPARRWLAVLAGTAALAGCGGGASETPERGGRPASLPHGWRTVGNRDAGFTIGIPRHWSERTRRGATLIRSLDRLVATTIGADRGSQGRSSPPAQYAEDTLRGLPDFEGDVSPRIRRVRGSPYRSARVDGTGTVGRTRRAQLITVAVFQRPGVVTYTAVVFRNALATSGRDEAAVSRMLRTLRAAAQRSGRSG